MSPYFDGEVEIDDGFGSGFVTTLGTAISSYPVAARFCVSTLAGKSVHGRILGLGEEEAV